MSEAQGKCWFTKKNYYTHVHQSNDIEKVLKLNLRGCQADLSYTCMYEQGSSNFVLLKMIDREQNP